jgi:hypothetical protein
MHRRSATEISMFDVPDALTAEWLTEEQKKVIRKSVDRFDAYLVYDHKQVVYHVHYDLVQKWANGKHDGPDYYDAISGEPVQKNPPIFDAGAFLVGFAGPAEKPVNLEARYIRNPIANALKR